MKKRFLGLAALLAFASFTITGCESEKALTSEEIETYLSEVVEKSKNINSTKSTETILLVDSEQSQTIELSGGIYDNDIYMNEGFMNIKVYAQQATYALFETMFEDENNLYYIYDIESSEADCYKITMDKTANRDELMEAMRIVTDETIPMLIDGYFTEDATITGVKKGKNVTITYEENFIAPASSNLYNREVKATIELLNGALSKIAYDYKFFEIDYLVQTVSGTYEFATKEMGEYDLLNVPTPTRYAEYVDKSIVNPIELPESTLNAGQIAAYLNQSASIVENNATSCVYKESMVTDYEYWKEENYSLVETTTIYGSGVDTVQITTSVSTDYNNIKTESQMQYFVKDNIIYGIYDDGTENSFKISAQYQEGVVFAGIGATASNGEPWFKYFYNTYKEMANNYNESGYVNSEGQIVIHLSAGINQVDNTVGVLVDAQMFITKTDAGYQVDKMAISITSLYDLQQLAVQSVVFEFGYEDNGNYTGELLNPEDFPDYQA